MMQSTTTNLDNQRPNSFDAPKYILNRQRPMLFRQSFPPFRRSAGIDGPRMGLESRKGDAMEVEFLPGDLLASSWTVLRWDISVPGHRVGVNDSSIIPEW